VGNHVLLEVKDNGRGISEAEMHNTKSIGLLGMRERAALLGGEVRVRGEPGKGTTVSVRIPRPARRADSIANENLDHRRSRRSTARPEADSR
jgi:nitrate/nitrite-specific signal transduction histidine kinase